MKLKGCKTWKKLLFHSLVLCERLGKNFLGSLNLHIYVISWISFPKKSHLLSLDKASFWVTMLKKVQTQRKSTAQNTTINSLRMVEWLILSSGYQLQNKEYYEVVEIEVRGYSWLFCQIKEMLSLLFSLDCTRTTHFHTVYVLLVLTILYGFSYISFRFSIYWHKPFSQQIFIITWLIGIYFLVDTSPV